MKDNFFKEIFIIFILVLLMFQRILVEIIPIFSYYDEFVTMIFAIMSTLKAIKRKKIIKEDCVMILLIILMIACGLMGN